MLQLESPVPLQERPAQPEPRELQDSKAPERAQEPPRLKMEALEQELEMPERELAPEQPELGQKLEQPGQPPAETCSRSPKGDRSYSESLPAGSSPGRSEETASLESTEC